MAADRTNTDPSPGKSRLDSAGPRLPASGKAGSRDDEAFKQSMAELSRRLGERVAQQSTGHPAAAATERRAALQAYDLARERRQIAMLGVAVAAVIGAGIVEIDSLRRRVHGPCRRLKRLQCARSLRRPSRWRLSRRLLLHPSLRCPRRPPHRPRLRQTSPLHPRPNRQPSRQPRRPSRPRTAPPAPPQQGRNQPRRRAANRCGSSRRRTRPRCDGTM